MLEIKLFNIFFKYLKNGACGIYFLLHQWNRHPSKPSSRGCHPISLRSCHSFFIIYTLSYVKGVKKCVKMLEFKHFDIGKLDFKQLERARLINNIYVYLMFSQTKLGRLTYDFRRVGVKPELKVGSWRS